MIEYFQQQIQNAESDQDGWYKVYYMLYKMSELIEVEGHVFPTTPVVIQKTKVSPTENLIEDENIKNYEYVGQRGRDGNIPAFRQIIDRE